MSRISLTMGAALAMAATRYGFDPEEVVITSDQRVARDAYQHFTGCIPTVELGAPDFSRIDLSAPPIAFPPFVIEFGEGPTREHHRPYQPPARDPKHDEDRMRRAEQKRQRQAAKQAKGMAR